VLNDRSGLYADLSGEGSVLAASAQIGGAPDLTSPAKLPPMEMPRHLEIRKERPKTVVGKLSRLELRRQLDQPVAA
jgi:hypothetical protein